MLRGCELFYLLKFKKLQGSKINCENKNCENLNRTGWPKKLKNLKFGKFENNLEFFGKFIEKPGISYKNHSKI